MSRYPHFRIYQFVCLLGIVLTGSLALGQENEMQGLPKEPDQSSGESPILNLLQRFRDEEMKLHEARLSGLHESFLNTSMSREKRLISLALGAQYVESNPRLALQYLSSAELSSDPTDKIFSLIRYYKALALLRQGGYSEAVAISESLAESLKGRYWERLLLSIQIEGHYGLQDAEKFLEVIAKYSEQYDFSRKQERIGRLAHDVLVRKGLRQETFDLLEILAKSYPASDESRWAFRRLQDLACQGDGAGRYFVSKKFLISIARNSILDNGLKDYLVAAVDQPLRLEDNSVRALTQLEKADLLFRMRFYPESSRIVRDVYETERTRPYSDLVPNLTFELGRIYMRMMEPAVAVRYFSRFVAKYPDHHLKNRALEGMGDALRYLGAFSEAAAVYSQIPNANEPSIAWLTFWSMFRSGQWANALVWLDTRDGHGFREGDSVVTLQYWRARILEKLDRGKEADAIYYSIMSQHPDSYYSHMIAARRADIVEKSPVGADRQAELAWQVDGEKQQQFKLAAKLLEDQPGEAGGSFQREEFTLVDDLARVGLNDVAKIYLADFKWASYNQAEAFAAASRLALVLGDYQPARKIRYMSNSPLRSLPRDWWSLSQHQILNRDIWKLYFPMAFEKQVEGYSANVRRDPFLLLSLMRAESFYNKEARSGVGAIGLMQLMPYTALKIASVIYDRKFEVLSLYKPEVNIAYGAYYIDKLLRYYQGNFFLAVAAYNAGPVAVNHWIESCKTCEMDEFAESIPYRETRRYVREVFSNYVQYSRIYGNKNPLENLPAMPGDLPDGEELY